MNKRVKKKWLKALRSGEYVQGTEQLAGDIYDGEAMCAFCCLGVLTNIYCEEEGLDFDVVASRPITGTAAANLKLYAYAPPCVVSWAGLENSNPIAGEAGSLARLNDSGHSFEAIADLIAANL